MHMARLPWTLVMAVAALLAGSPAEAAPSSKDARRIYEEATAAFGLGRYAEAAEKYEAAFGIRPDPALLYNAAQSYRLAGNKPRALELYRNYVRLYPDAPNAEDARTHVVALKKAIEDERPPIEMARPPTASTARPPSPVTPPSSPAPPPAPAPAPPVAVAPASAMPAPVETTLPTAPPPAAPAPAADGSVALVARPESQSRSDDKRPLTHQTWFWVAVGGAVAVIGATVILLATRGEKFPDATLGTARGN